MKTQGFKVAMAGFAVGVMVLAGCSKDNSAELKKELQESGMTSEQADCIVNGLNSRGVALDQYDEPSAEDTGKITDVVTECVMQDLDIPDVTTP
jgi:hypothetical protein